jgi:TetR/AcrR family transcriptional regulator
MPTKPGERKTQILETLAQMLQQPQSEKITTAALAAKLDVSEAALYRHFASKAQMFEGLIEFIEQTVFSLINKIAAEETQGLKQLESVIALLLAFAQKNQGMTRVLIGDALVNEDHRLQARINQLHDRIEASLRQSLRVASSQNDLDPSIEASAMANLLMCFVTGRWHQFAKGGFKRMPTELWGAQWQALGLGSATPANQES